MRLQNLSNFLIHILVIGSMISSLYYLSLPNEVKYSQKILFGNVSYISAISAWFYSDYLWFGIIQLFSKFTYPPILKLHAIALCIRGAVYIVQYLEILPHDSRHRLSYLLGYIFLLSLSTLYIYHKGRDA